MKKLFFLCPFLFMSMQTQAQLCVVQTYLSDVSPSTGYIKIFYSGQEEPTIIPVEIPDDSNNATWDEPEQDLINVLGGIMSNGY